MPFVLSGKYSFSAGAGLSALSGVRLRPKISPVRQFPRAPARMKQTKDFIFDWGGTKMEAMSVWNGFREFRSGCRVMLIGSKEFGKEETVCGCLKIY
ncbi:hypothetical protein CEB3_c33550 [Peptococcaceae bacterium CEB3]|nr:hypothetical protein CEB3_c33550 [Peptococcaceae bacterium CEB3]